MRIEFKKNQLQNWCWDWPFCNKTVLVMACPSFEVWFYFKPELILAQLANGTHVMTKVTFTDRIKNKRVQFLKFKETK